MNLVTENHISQRLRWPAEGEHIMAHHDDETVVVYQAYRPAIGEFAVHHGRLDGPDFSLNRMSWVKPNFLWMMYRSGWGTKVGQEITLGLRIRRRFFDQLLRAAVPSGFDAAAFSDRETWQQAVQASEVRLQCGIPTTPPAEPGSPVAPCSWGCAGKCSRHWPGTSCWKSSISHPSWRLSASMHRTTTPR